MWLVARWTGWSEAELMAMPVERFERYLEVSLQAAGIDPREGGEQSFEAPEEPGVLPPEVLRALEQLEAERR